MSRLTRDAVPVVAGVQAPAGQHAAAGQQQVAGGDAHERRRFKIVTRVVMAMKRFQASLNPTYSYGKRPSDTADEITDGHRVLVQPRAGAAAVAHERRTSSGGGTVSGRTTSGRTTSGRPTSAGQHHGHKGNLLFRPLPNPDTAVKSS